jgi:hypothetical protein
VPSPSAIARLAKLTRLTIELFMRQVEEQVDARAQLGKGARESLALFLVRAANGRRILYTPMGSDRAPWPERTGFVGRVVANREDEVELPLVSMRFFFSNSIAKGFTLPAG